MKSNEIISISGTTPFLPYTRRAFTANVLLRKKKALVRMKVILKPQILARSKYVLNLANPEKGWCPKDEAMPLKPFKCALIDFLSAATVKFLIRVTRCLGALVPSRTAHDDNRYLASLQSALHVWILFFFVASLSPPLL